MTPQERLAHIGDYQAFVYAKSLETGRNTMIGAMKGKSFEADQIEFPLNVSSLDPGTYRMSSILKYEDLNKHKATSLESDSLVQVF